MIQSILAVSRPTGLWEWLMLDVLSFISNYGLRVVLLIVVLKLLMFPLDFFQRKNGIENAKIMAAMKPELDEVQTMYAADRATLYAKQRDVQRKHGYKPLGACLPLILTLVVFITLFNGFRLIAAYQNQVMVSAMFDKYVAHFDEQNETSNLTLEQLQDSLDRLYIIDARAEFNAIETPDFEFDPTNFEQLETILARAPMYTAVTTDLDIFLGDSAHFGLTGEDATNRESNIFEAKQHFAQLQVLELYQSELRESFVLVKNIWREDIPWASPVPSQSEMRADITHRRLSRLENEDRIITEYNNFSHLVQDHYSDTANGYMLWAFGAVALSLVQQWLTRKQQKQSGAEAMNPAMNGGMMKGMMFIMPIMIGYFAISNPASFTIYMVVNSGMGIATNLASGWFLRGRDKLAQVEAEQTAAQQGVRSIRGKTKK